MSQSSLITPTIVLITGHFSNSAKFRGNVKIPQQRTNSVSRLQFQIPRSAENCGSLYITHINVIFYKRLICLRTLNIQFVSKLFPALKFIV